MKRLFAFKSHYQKIKEFYNRYERWLMPVTLGVGFVVDYVTFVNIQVKTALIILYIYWFIAALTITFIHVYDARKISDKYKYLRLFAPLLIQFTFGGLLSNSFIFYWFSGSVWTSWPFILAFVGLMISNDALRHHFLRPIVQIIVYFFCTFSIISVTLPFAFNSLNPWLFVLASALSLIAIFLFTWLLTIFSPSIKQKWLALVISACSILGIMNFFYFANLIPPIPLAIREAGVYHSLQRSGFNYTLKGEQESFWQKLVPGQTIHLKPGERVYVFTSIYAPKNLSTPIVHEWQYYDEAKGKWVIKDTLAFNLSGGRQEGFRGYSWKMHNLEEGKWRVYIKTKRGQTLGRVRFNLVKTETSVELREIVR
jgi:hypothetical protein